MQPVFSSIQLYADTYSLNPLLEPGCTAHLTVTGVRPDGSTCEIPARQIRFSVTTLLTCSDAEVASIDRDGILTPLTGGYVRVDASYVGYGKGLTGSVKIVIRPFFHAYHQTLTFKLFLAMEPYGSLRKETPAVRDESVTMDFAEAAELLTAIDRLTCHIPKICYLVGWQRGGHDHLYPALNEVNPRLKRPCDETAADSLRWLMQEGKRCHTAVSLHINLVDAYDDSPLWQEYADNHIFCEDENGNILCASGGFEELSKQYGIRVANVEQKRFLDSGFFYRRVEELLTLLPELRDSHTIHIDNWRADGCPAMGISKEEDEEALRKMFLWLREQGLDATSEGSFHGRMEPMTGLQPMTYWDIPYHPSVIPPSLYCGGRGARVDTDPRFGDSIHIENVVRENIRYGYPITEGILDEFCMYTLPWYFLNHFRLLDFDGETAIYTENVRAYIENGVPMIYWGSCRIRTGTTMFVPLLWCEEPCAILYTLRDSSYVIDLPEAWGDVAAVNVYYMDRLGRGEPELVQEAYPLRDGKLYFLVEGRHTCLIRPLRKR